MAANCRVLRIVGIFGLFFGVQVIEVPVELVEAVNGRQELVAIAQVVLPELSRRVAEGLEKFRDGRVLGLDALLGARHADGEQARCGTGSARA